MNPKLMVKKERSESRDSSKEHGSPGFASNSPCHDLFANNLTNTVTSTPPAVIHEDTESCQEDTPVDTDITDWDDSNEEEHGKSGGDETMFFQRLRVNPPPQSESLITLALQSPQHHVPTPRVGHVAPRYTFTDVRPARRTFFPMKDSPGESDEAPLRIRQKPSGAARQSLNDVGRSPAQPIPPTSNGANEPVVFSPMTACLNMVATEVPDWLGRHLLWERAEKNLTANAVLKRRRTHGNVTTLPRIPQRPHVTKDNINVYTCSWDQDFAWEAFGGCHTKGW